MEVIWQNFYSKNSMVFATDYRKVGELTVTDTIMTNSFWIGLYSGMSDEVIGYMIEKIREFVENKKGIK